VRRRYAVAEITRALVIDAVVYLMGTGKGLSVGIDPVTTPAQSVVIAVNTRHRRRLRNKALGLNALLACAIEGFQKYINTVMLH